jgi:P-type Cu+ transporter
MKQRGQGPGAARSGGQSDDPGEAMTFDPVCGMRIERALASSSTIYQGRKYSFCSDSCRATFDRDPEHYVGGDSPAPPGP